MEDKAKHLLISVCILLLLIYLFPTIVETVSSASGVQITIGNETFGDDFDGNSSTEPNSLWSTWTLVITDTEQWNGNASAMVDDMIGDGSGVYIYDTPTDCLFLTVSVKITNAESGDVAHIALTLDETTIIEITNNALEGTTEWYFQDRTGRDDIDYDLGVVTTDWTNISIAYCVKSQFCQIGFDGISTRYELQSYPSIDNVDFSAELGAPTMVYYDAVHIYEMHCSSMTNETATILGLMPFIFAIMILLWSVKEWIS